MYGPDVESKLIAYGTEFIRSYSDTINTNYLGALDRIQELDMEANYFPLYGRCLGNDTALAVLFTSNDFYLFFLDEHDKMVTILKDSDADPAFSRDWTLNTPDAVRIMQARDELGISISSILKLDGNTECLAPGADFVLTQTVESMVLNARTHGNTFGNQSGERAENDLPNLLRAAERRRQEESFSQRYASLSGSDMSPQVRGQEFEKLWRDVLEFYGWHPKKFRISGEENDFTAIYQGLHILGEVRWFRGDKPMDGAKMREFLGKLDPRPQTIGLFVSHSGVGPGAESVRRRAVNSKTVVVFDREDIEAVLCSHVDIGAIFNEKLRSAYDYLFEEGQEGKGPASSHRRP